MTSKQRENLKKMGGRTTTVQEFLSLSERQMWLIDLKIDLGEAIREHRSARSWSHEELAEQLALSAPKIADLEAGGPDVGVDEQLLALRVLRVTRGQLREVLENEFENEEADKTLLVST